MSRSRVIVLLGLLVGGATSVALFGLIGAAIVAVVAIVASALVYVVVGA